MEASRLVEEEEEVLRQPASNFKRRGVIAVALSCVGALCLAGQSMKQTSDSFTTRILATKDKFLTKLQDEKMFEGEFSEVSASFAFAPKDVKLDGMSIDFNLGQETDKKYEEAAPFMVLRFKAQDGQEEALSAALKAVYDEVMNLNPQMEENSPFAIDFTHEEGGATIRVNPTSDMPPVDVPPSLPNMGFAMGAKFGRSFEDMFDNKALPCLTVFGGFSAYVSATMPPALIASMTPYPYGDLIGQIVSERFDETVLYKSDDELAEVAQALAIPSLKDVLEMEAGGFEGLGEEYAALKEAVQALPKYADGLEEFSVLNLPGGWALRTTFNKFHITPVLSQLVQ